MKIQKMSALELNLGIVTKFVMDNQVLLICNASLLYLKLIGTPKPIVIALSVHYRAMSSIDYAYQHTNCMFFCFFYSE